MKSLDTCRCEETCSDCDCVREAAGTLVVAGSLSLHPVGHITLHHSKAFRILIPTCDEGELEFTFRPGEGWSFRKNSDLLVAQPS